MNSVKIGCFSASCISCIDTGQSTKLHPASHCSEESNHQFADWTTAIMGYQFCLILFLWDVRHVQDCFPAVSRRPIRQRPRPPVRVISEFDSPDGFRPQVEKIIYWEFFQLWIGHIFNINTPQGNPYRGVTFETATEKEIVSGPPQGKLRVRGFLGFWVPRFRTWFWTSNHFNVDEQEMTSWSGISGEWKNSVSKGWPIWVSRKPYITPYSTIPGLM